MEHLEKELDLLNIFKKNLLEFLDELIEQFEEEGDLIMLRFFFSEQVPVELIMKQYITFVYPHRQLIRSKNETFFLEKENIFGISPKDKVVHFKTLYLRMAPDDRDTLWSWVQTFLTICEKYIQLNGGVV